MKSAYNLARSGEKKDGGECSNTSIMKWFWHNLWRAKVLNKVRVFGWKACQNILPTKMNLFHRQVMDDPICEECGLEPETVLHVLCHCKKAKEVWNHCCLLHRIEGNGDFTDVLYSNGLKQDQDSHLVHLILMIAWGLWRNRNERRFGEKTSQLPQYMGLPCQCYRNITQLKKLEAKLGMPRHAGINGHHHHMGGTR